MNSETNKAIGSRRAPSMHRDPKRRLHEHFYIANRMKPYANRLRVRLEALDLSRPDHQRQLEANRTKMLKILTTKKVSSSSLTEPLL